MNGLSQEFISHDKKTPTHNFVHIYTQTGTIQIRTEFKCFLCVPRLWSHGTQDGSRKDILYDIRSGRNTACFDNVSINRRTTQHVPSAHVSSSEEKIGNEEHRGLQHGQSSGALWVVVNGCNSLLWSVYFLLLREVDVFQVTVLLLHNCDYHWLW